MAAQVLAGHRRRVHIDGHAPAAERWASRRRRRPHVPTSPALLRSMGSRTWGACPTQAPAPGDTGARLPQCSPWDPPTWLHPQGVRVCGSPMVSHPPRRTPIPSRGTALGKLGPRLPLGAGPTAGHGWGAGCGSWAGGPKGMSARPRALPLHWGTAPSLCVATGAGASP